MIFVFAEDATLHVVADINAVRVMCESIDVESDVYSFYNAEGRPLKARFITPNRQRRLFGLLSTLEQGEYTLEVGNPAEHDPISVALAETAALERNDWFNDLNAVREYLHGCGALD
jgi:hypothetical protein